MSRLRIVVIGLALLCTGCGGSDYDMAPVTGTVTLDTQPLEGATVTFSPMGTGTTDAGPSSTGTTDADGKYTLTSAEGFSGAVVGRHQVRVTTVSDDGGSSESDDIYSGGGNAEKLPARYNTETTVEFDVPAGGLDAANIDATSDP